MHRLHGFFATLYSLMKKRFVRSLLFLLLTGLVPFHSANSQSFNSWEAITSFNNVTDITITETGTVWGISKGGLFSFEEDSFENTYTTVEGMYRLDAETIEYLPQQNVVLIGYTDGMIDIFDPDTEEFSRLEDIFRVTAFTSKRINGFFQDGARLFVATDFGIVKYDIATLLVIDSYSRLGSFDSGIVVEDLVIADGLIYAATQQGVAVGDLDLNLNTAASWENYDQTDGLPSGGLAAIQKFEDRIFASGTDLNFIYENDSWQQTNLFGNSTITEYSLSQSGETLLALSESVIFKVDANLNTESTSPDALRLNTVLFDDEITNKIYTGTFNRGIGFADLFSDEFEFESPSGPNINFFEGINFDGETLFSGTSRFSARDNIEDNSKGYHIFRNGVWQSFNRHNTPVLNNSIFRKAFKSVSTDEYYYFGSWGRGIARHHKETDEIHVFNSSNSAIEGWVSLDPDFPVIIGLETDSERDVWAVSYFGSTPLYYQRPGDDDWIGYEKGAAASSSDEYGGLFIDSHDQKWVTLLGVGNVGRGILVVDTGNPEDVNDQTSVKISDSPGSGNLPNGRVNAIIEDLDGEVWVGTDRGIAKFVFPQFVITGSAQEREGQWLLNEDPDAESPFLLRDINVSAMAVNSANQKWIGTANDGVWLLNSRGSRIIKHYNSENSPLLSDNIVDITVEQETGLVYISTDVGLITYQDIPSEPVREMETLKVFPNPFVYDRHDRIFVEDLSDQTTIRVLGVDGTLIRSIDNRGGRAEWDGRDFNGNRVGSGVYLVVALDPDGSERGVGKVVIIR